jgi:CRP-like cAMP-binding protein
MEGIPPARASDNEDVIWALETAESLWKRNSRVDAIVWLRRAAQEAAEAGDDDRASSLMVEAATLTETMARHSTQSRAAGPVTQPPPADAINAASAAEAQRSTPPAAPADAGDIDALLASSDDVGESDIESLDDAEVLEDSDMILSLAPPTPVPTGDPAAEEPAVHVPPPDPPPVIAATSQVEAGLETSNDAASGADVDALVALVSIIPEPVSEGREAISLAPEPVSEGREAISLVPEPISASQDIISLIPEPDSASHEVAEPTPEPAQQPESAQQEERSASDGITKMGEGAVSAMDLAGIGALAGTSEAQREQLVHDAVVLLCSADVDLPGFALAVILEGEVCATAGPHEATLERFGPGSIIRATDTLGEPVSARFRVTADDTTLALWNDAKLSSALALVPDAAIDDALRATADRVQAWASVASSSMGGQLHEEVRLRLVERLSVRALKAGAELFVAGDAVLGMFLVGSGSISVDGALATVIGPGEFVFAGATLSNGRASATARAGDSGALVLFSDRRTTQELYATEPLLLELLAAGS